MFFWFVEATGLFVLTDPGFCQKPFLYLFGWPVISVLLSTLVIFYTCWFVCVKSILPFRYKANLIMVELSDVFLNLVGKYLIEKFFIYFRQRDCFVVCLIFLYIYVVCELKSCWLHKELDHVLSWRLLWSPLRSMVLVLWKSGKMKQYFMWTWEVLALEVLSYCFAFLFHTSQGTQMHFLRVLVCASVFRSFYQEGLCF